MHHWLAVYCWDKTNTTYVHVSLKFLTFKKFEHFYQNVKVLRNFDLRTFREASMESAMFSMMDLPTCDDDDARDGGGGDGHGGGGGGDDGHGGDDDDL